MSTEKKLKEAAGHIQQAEKCLKTSLMKWNPDLDGAASEYIKAATCYKNAKALADARGAYLKAAEMQERMKSPFHAAKSYEQAGLLSKENKELDQAVHYMERASFMFQEHGTPDTAALCLEKAAKMVEQTKPAHAVELYKKASDVADIEDRPRQSAENIGKAGRLLINLERYEEAIECLTKEINFYAAAENYAMINKLVLAVVLIKLTLGDYVAADQFYRSSISHPGFTDSEECAAVDELLQAYDDGDEETARRVLSIPLIKYMDNCFAKLSKKLVIPGGMRVGKSEAGVTEINTVGGAGGGGGAIHLDDDEEGGLC
ncbi:gamma-soluble NSF attachment protein-like [Ruditapes philippinarum]|uniref:gamma-soluble NSF attachment protein-like n=1 Tax=Ruditapes philippinarum TaxID=129788 RepID=UPI00295B11A9|nr:gamma-soluble NSF attachment protein-like [Ruditapes philippinarum]